MAGRKKRTVSTGSCALCGETLAKQAMGRHVASCLDRESSKKRAARGRAFHIVAEGWGLAPYWLHIQARADSTLRDLDRFLRDTWLECCGHLSAFTIGETRYESDEEMSHESDHRTMDMGLGRVLVPGLVFIHEYDFGTTTRLRLRVVSERPAPSKGGHIRLLARNLPPAILCVSCGKPARQLCGQCIWEGKGAFCGACARKHPCGEEMLYPLANSPRSGMCGYVGD